MSVLVPVLNEERHIRATVAAMQAQRFDGTIELLFADGESTDSTREILTELAADDPRIRVFANPRRRTASGLNVCLREARGDYVARMDAHTYYADTYLAAGVARLRRGDTDWVSGPAVPSGVGPVSRAVAIALGSPLGRGGSRKWSPVVDGGEERELDSGVFGGVWRRERLLEAGGWDERWPINQDSEMAARFIRAGARLVLVPTMVGRYVPRGSFRGLATQYFRYGFYRARTFRHHPETMRRSHLAPTALASSVLLAAGPRPLRGLARSALAAYAVAAAASGARSALGESARDGGSIPEGLLVAAVLPVMHLGWGFGTLAGALRFGFPLDALQQVVMHGKGTWLRRREEPVYAPSLFAAASTVGDPRRSDPPTRIDRRRSRCG